MNSCKMRRWLMLILLLLFIGWVWFVSRLGNSLHGVRKGEPIVEIQKDVYPPIAEQKTHRMRKKPVDWRDSPLNKCSWIKNLVDNGESIGKPLPQSGKDNGGVTFWLKQPVKHTIDPESGEEIMILKYNVYDPKWTQHTDKFTNTVKVLTKFADATIFPKLFGFCENIDGFHYIAVEYIGSDMRDLEKPTTAEQCYKRAKNAINLFTILDEKYHLMFADFKPGQWMARKDGTLVLQDVDDILEPRAKSPYPDQYNWLKTRVQNSKGLSLLEVDRPFKTTVFPRGEINIRYSVLNTQLLFENLGFKWSHDCDLPFAFKTCLRKLYEWTMSLEDDWPSPKQVEQALEECYAKGEFRKTKREPALWRDLDPLPPDKYAPVSACVREYDNDSVGDIFTKCQHSCCRAKGGQRCYYTAPKSKCK